MPSQSNIRKFLLLALLVAPLALVLHSSHKLFAASGACTAPATDYGTVTSTVNIPAAGTYRIWSRMSAASSSANTYMLQIDTSGAASTCYTVGGSTVPTYASGATTFFANNTTNWIDKTSAGTVMDVTLTQGNHSFEMIGNAAGVVLDRLVLTQDTTCTPTGVGTNCATPQDKTPPTVSINALPNGGMVSTTTTATATASDDVAVASVQFSVDGTLQTPAVTSPPYTFSINPASYTIGSTHTLVATATDTSGNSASSSTVNFTIVDTTNPVATITSPVSGATLSGTTTVTATGTDNDKVSSMSLFIDGSSTAVATDTTSPFSFSFDTTALNDGTHTMVAKAYDPSGNVGASTAVSFIVNNGGTSNDHTPPTVSMSAPATNGTVISGTYTLGVAASDASGIKQVQFFVDGTAVNTDTSAPFTYAYDTTTLGNGTHTFYAIATDNSANLNHAQSATISAIVTNPQFISEDVNQDGHVNLQDFSLIAADFGNSGSAIKTPRADINGDGTVNLQDFSLLASKFGSE